MTAERMAASYSSVGKSVSDMARRIARRRLRCARRAGRIRQFYDLN